MNTQPRHSWKLRNERTGETTTYWSNTPGLKVTPEHALTSPSVKAWAGGDKIIAEIPEPFTAP